MSLEKRDIRSETEQNETSVQGIGYKDEGRYICMQRREIAGQNASD